MNKYILPGKQTSRPAIYRRCDKLIVIFFNVSWSRACKKLVCPRFKTTNARSKESTVSTSSLSDAANLGC